MVVRPVKLRNSILMSMKMKLRFKRATCRCDFVLKSSIKTIMSSRNGMRMMDTNMAARDEIYSLMVSLLMNL